jgi:hypothetical protein
MWQLGSDQTTDGPTTRQNQLRPVAVTDDGARIWLAGPSDALAC